MNTPQPSARPARPRRPSLREIRRRLQEGLVIPAHPLALNSRRRLDETRQRGLTRYYHAAGAGGLAVGVHTTQFAIRAPKHGLLSPVLELASATLEAADQRTGRMTLRIAGVCGRLPQALREAGLARELGYDVALVSLAGLRSASEEDLVHHCREVSRILPVMGFYLQPAVGGRCLSYRFWRRFAEIEDLVGIKVAPFNRYQTLDVLRAVRESSRSDLALYTGNDDHIVLDLLSGHPFGRTAKGPPLGFCGGLLGQWAVWTSQAVPLLRKCRQIRAKQASIPADMLSLAADLTDANAALFDAANAFRGCIAGIHEALRRHGLLRGTWCLDPAETFGPGQLGEIDRIWNAYPHLRDDEFILENRDRWLS